MAAGVHHAGVQGSIGQSGLLRDWQGVDVCPDADRAISRGPADDRADSMPRNAALIRDLQGIQPAADLFLRPDLMFTELWMHMKIAAKREHFLADLFHLRFYFFQIKIHKFLSDPSR